MAPEPGQIIRFKPLFSIVDSMAKGRGSLGYRGAHHTSVSEMADTESRADGKLEFQVAECVIMCTQDTSAQIHTSALRMLSRPIAPVPQPVPNNNNGINSLPPSRSKSRIIHGDMSFPPHTMSILCCQILSSPSSPSRTQGQVSVPWNDLRYA
jgi:hypothetical protein